MEGPRRQHGVLTRHRIDDEERVVGRRRIADRADLVHQGLVDGQTTRGVDDHHIPTDPRRLGHPGSRDVDRARRLAEDVDTDLCTEHPELLDGGGTLEVRRDQIWLAALLLEPRRELCGGRGLTGTLETRENDDGRGTRRVGHLQSRTAQHLDELLVDRLDDLLAGAEALAQRLTRQAFAQRLEEGPHHRQLDVGF